MLGVAWRLWTRVHFGLPGAKLLAINDLLCFGAGALTVCCSR